MGAAPRQIVIGAAQMGITACWTLVLPETMLHSVDVRHLRYMLAVAEESSFTRAAERLGAAGTLRVDTAVVWWPEPEAGHEARLDVAAQHPDQDPGTPLDGAGLLAAGQINMVHNSRAGALAAELAGPAL